MKEIYVGNVPKHLDGLLEMLKEDSSALECHRWLGDTYLNDGTHIQAQILMTRDMYKFLVPDGIDKRYGAIKKPPLGIMPRQVWLDARKAALCEAIKRYLEEGKAIPPEWVEEYNSYE